MGSQNNILEIKLTLEKEGSKTYYEYDAQNRISAKYEAGVQAVTGHICLRTQFEYRSPASTQVLKKQEDIYAWDSSWDI